MALGRTALLTIATIVVLATSLIFTLFFVAALVISHSKWAGLSISAAVLVITDLMGLAYSLLGFTAGYKREGRHSRKRKLFWLFLALCTIAHCLTIAMLASLQAQKQVPSTIFRHSWSTFVYVLWALVATSIFCHFIYMMMLYSRLSGSSRAMIGEDTSNLSSYMDKEPRALFPQTGSMYVTSPGSAPSTITIDEEHALKYAPQQVLPSNSSRSKLVQSIHPTSTSSPPNQSRRTSIDSGISTMPSARTPMKRYDAFSPRPCTPPQQHRLEPIPGSASNSPGRALEIAKDTQPPVFRNRTDSSSSLDSMTDQSRVPPRFRKYSTNQHPSSPIIISEALIHPLFRSDSPLPPPTPTITTTVTASAFGGRTISIEDLTRAQSRSRPSSPAHLSNSVNPNRRSSLNRNSPRLDMVTGSPTKQRARSLERSRMGGALQKESD